MSDENLLDSSRTPQFASTNAEKNDGVVYGQLEDIAGPNTSNEEFVRNLLATPKEKLIPWEDCTLPSKGLYYGWTHGTIQVRAMSQMAEKVLATQRLAQSGQSIDYLFKECCNFPEGFDPAMLLVGDRIFLLYYLRGITHGNLYEFQLTCPNTACGSISTHTYDLNELASTITFANEDLGPEPFKVVLPYLTKATGREVYVNLRFIRAADANGMLAKKKQLKNSSAHSSRQPKFKSTVTSDDLDNTLNENLEKVIVDIMGVSDEFAIKQFVDKLHAQDTAAIREWLKDNTPGIDTTIKVTCPDCENEYSAQLPISEGFFRPAKR